MSSGQSSDERIIELANFLDPEAFSFEAEGQLAHRREAALEEARNRVERAEVGPAAITPASAEG